MNTFQHRHYAAIARVIRDRRSQYDLNTLDHTKADTIQELQDNLARMFARDNARFDGERFARACDPAQTPNGRDR